MIAIGIALTAAQPWTPHDAPPATIALEVTDGSRTADGSDEHIATATVTDAQGKPVPGATVTFTLSQPRQGEMFAATDVTGVAIVVVRSTKAGQVTVTAAVQGGGASEPRALRFVAGEPDPARSVVERSPDIRVADGIDSHWLRIQMRDRFDNPVPGISVDISGDLPLNVSTAGVTGEDGRVRADISTKYAGSHGISALWNGVLIWEYDAVFRPDSPDLNRSTLAITPDTLRYRQQEFYVVEARVTDSNGNPIAGLRVDFTSSEELALTTSSGVTNSLGVASTTAVASTSTTHTVSASLKGQNIGLLSIELSDLIAH
jgi:adhesin/invasin